MKICSKKTCKQINPQSLGEFSKSKNSKDGLHYHCKSCDRERKKTPESKKKAKERREIPAIKQAAKERRERPEIKEVVKERRKTPESRQKQKINRQTPKVTQLDRQRNLKPERIQYRKEYRENSKIQKISKERERTPKYKQIRKKWRQQDQKDNPSKYVGTRMKRHVAKLKRIPIWLTKDHFKEIKFFYILSHELQWLSEEKLHVDHIIPLQGKNISGLHVPWNLQIISESDNCSKSNSFDFTYNNNGWKDSKC